jgi:integrase/recombinase XerD
MNQKPIYCRITLNGKRKQFSTGINVEGSYWNSKSKEVIKTHKSSSVYNSQLENIKSKLQNIFLFFQFQEQSFTAEDILVKYLGKNLKKEESVLSYYLKYLEKLKKLIGIEIKQNTYAKFFYVSQHLERFILWKFNKKDIPLRDLNLQFLDDFDFYLKTEKRQVQITINKTIQRLRAPIKQAISEGYLDRDPFILYKSKTVRKEVIYLTVEELKTFEETVLQQKRLILVQHLFIFCCYTGLAYNEMVNLKKQNIQIGFDGMNWIQMKREKTQRQISIPILPKAQEIIDKYTTDNTLLFSSISNQKFNSYLKEIADIIGIEKRLTHHIARKTFASTVLLYNDVPMEIVSELLGHSNLLITQESYGKIVQNKVSQAMLTLAGKLK